MLLPVIAAASNPVPPLTGLALWLKGDAGITQAGGTVSLWADQSGNGLDLSQATGANQPTYVASAINGLPGVSFDATNKVLSRATSPLAAGQATRSIIAVFTLTNSTDPGTVCCFRSTAPEYVVYFDGSVPGVTYIYGDGGGSNATIPSPVAGSILFEEYGSVLAKPVAYVNGVAQVVTGGGFGTVTGDTGANGFFVGNDPGSDDNLAGPLCELLIYDHVLSGPDAAAVRAYVNARYRF